MKTAALFAVTALAQEDGWSTNPIDSAEYEGEDLATLIEARSGANKIPGSRKGGRKRMINSMAIRDFWDFEHYGCWCIEKKGYGPAVDEVDFACLAHSKCWGCAKAEHGDECDGLNTPYKWKFIKDSGTSVAVDIKCLDSDPCRRSVCECDRKLATDLRNMEAAYNPEFRNQATKHELCPKPDHSLARRFTVSEKLDSCCGDSVYKFPFASAGGKRACCGTRTYDTDIMQCCDQDNSLVKYIGTC